MSPDRQRASSGFLDRAGQATTRDHSGPWTPAEDSLVPGLTILGHPDAARIGERAALPGIDRDRTVALSRLEPLFVAPGGTRRHPLADDYLSRKPLRLGPGTATGALVLRRDGCRMKVEVDGAPLAENLELDAADLARGTVLALSHRVVLLLHLLDPLYPSALPDHGLVGASSGLVRVRREIGRVADLDMPVLLRGETGTGKELVAGALHHSGARRDGAFVAVNMASIPPTLAAAELFGAARGAFTGADKRRPGYFRRAHGGTLFLDEIGETPPEVQVQLLRCLETGEIQPVGAERAEKVDVRIIAATDADLETEAANESFNAPLLYRLAGYEIRIPPLRERRDDFGRLFYQFLARELATLGEDGRLVTAPGGRPWLPADLVARLALYDWPGNVRELRNVARHLAVAGRGAAEARLYPGLEELLEASARRTSARAGEPSPKAAHGPPSKPRRPAEIREEELLEALRARRFRLQATADDLGISRSALYSLIDKSPSIRKASDLGRGEIEAVQERSAGHLEKMADELEVSETALKRRMKQLGMR